MKSIQRLCITIVMLILSCHAAMAQWDNIEHNSLMRTLYKQVYEVRGRVFGVDEFDTIPYPLQGANIKVVCMGDTTQMEGQSAWSDGRYNIWMALRERLKDTRVKVTISYVGMETYEKIFSPAKGKEDGVDKYTIDIDSLVMHSLPLTTDEVEVIAELKRMYQRGDTTIFNVGAYEMPSGSVLLDLVRRLPGLKYQQGKMTYQGQDITEIRLNGDSFFKRDMSIALNNMPNEKLKALKVYEVLNDTLDEASDKHMVMDMETKDPMMGTTFSELAAGTNESFRHYLFTGSTSLWRKNGPQINAFFHTQDIPNEGNYQVKTINTNSNISFEQQFKNFGIDGYGSYNYNHNATRNQNLNKTYLPDYTQNSVSISSNDGWNKAWSGGATINRHFNNNSFGSINFDLTDDRSADTSESLDSLSNEGEGLVSTTRMLSSNTGHNKNANFYANYNIYLNDGRDELALSYSMNHSENDAVSLSRSTSQFFQLGDSVRDVNHRILTPTKNNNINAGADYSHRWKNGLMLRMGYHFVTRKNTSVQNYEDILADGSLQQVDSLHYDKMDRQSSHQLSPMLFYRNDDFDFNINGNISFVRRAISNDQYGNNEYISDNGVTVNLSNHLNYRLGKNSVSFDYGLNTSLPGISEMSKVIDYRDPMNITVGNPNLSHPVNHRFNASFRLKSLMRLNLGYNVNDNQITHLAVIDRKTGARRSTSVNIDGNWNTNERIFFTIPIHDFTLNLTANHTFNHAVSMVQNTTDVEAHKGTTRSHNISANIDGAYGNKYWIMNASMRYSKSINKSDYMNNTNVGQNLGFDANLTYSAPFGLETTTNFSLNKPFGYEMAAANKAEVMWGITAEYNFCHHKYELRLDWRDILHSYKGFNASMNQTNYFENRTFGETSMIVLTFAYHMNAFD